jgi:hypothetical protein
MSFTATTASQSSTEHGAIPNDPRGGFEKVCVIKVGVIHRDCCFLLARPERVNDSGTPGVMRLVSKRV